jgi:hypothetical protein
MEDVLGSSEISFCGIDKMLESQARVLTHLPSGWDGWWSREREWDDYFFQDFLEDTKRA